MPLNDSKFPVGHPVSRRIAFSKLVALLFKLNVTYRVAIATTSDPFRTIDVRDLYDKSIGLNIKSKLT